MLLIYKFRIRCWIRSFSEEIVEGRIGMPTVEKERRQMFEAVTLRTVKLLDITRNHHKPLWQLSRGEICFQGRHPLTRGPAPTVVKPKTKVSLLTGGSLPLTFDNGRCYCRPGRPGKKRDGPIDSDVVYNLVTSREATRGLHDNGLPRRITTLEVMRLLAENSYTGI